MKLSSVSVMFLAEDRSSLLVVLVFPFVFSLSVLDSEPLGAPNVLPEVKRVGTLPNGNAVVDEADGGGGLALKRLDVSVLDLKRKLAEAPLLAVEFVVVVVAEAGGMALKPLNPEKANAGLSLSFPELPLLVEWLLLLPNMDVVVVVVPVEPRAGLAAFVEPNPLNWKR